MILLHGDYTGLFLMIGAIGLGGLAVLIGLNYLIFRYFRRRHTKATSSDKLIFWMTTVVVNLAIIGALFSLAGFIG